MDQLAEVVKYILYRCRENNTPITEVMASFIAQTILNPSTALIISRDWSLLPWRQTVRIGNERSEGAGDAKNSGEGQSVNAYYWYANFLRYLIPLDGASKTNKSQWRCSYNWIKNRWSFHAVIYCGHILRV